MADKDICTGCGACVYVCPMKCIKLEDNGIYGLLPEIDASKCIECGKCARVCPILEPIHVTAPTKAYAARSTDISEAFTSASGGLASTLYRYALDNGYSIAGAVQLNDFSVKIILSDDKEMIQHFKNSKYVYSSALDLYSQLNELLKSGGKALIAALPCQIAAIRKIFKENENLFLIDIVCHGTTPTPFLQQHIRMIEEKTKQSVAKMYFRDPSMFTYTFTMSMYNIHGQRFYAKRTKDGDTYQYGYHRAVSYRENCYNCHFACRQRTGDLSLADFPGLGRQLVFPYPKKNINCVLVNTEKGKLLFGELISNKLIEAYERPLEEAIQGNGQLRKPVQRSKDRLIFKKRFLENNTFEEIMFPIMKRGLRKERVMRYLQFPKRVINRLNRIIKSYR